MRVEPPTRTTSSMSLTSTPASLIACCEGSSVRSQKVGNELLELGARELELQVLRARGVRGDEGQVDFRLERRRELDLRPLRGLLEPLERHLVRREIDALVLFELLDHPVDDALVQVVAAEMSVSIRRLDLDDAVADLQDRDVEGAAAKIDTQRWSLPSSCRDRRRAPRPSAR